MPAASVSVLSLLESSNIRGNLNVSGVDKEGFQSLLDINVGVDNDRFAEPGSDKKHDKEEPVDPVAAAVDSPAVPARERYGRRDEKIEDKNPDARTNDAHSARNQEEPASSSEAVHSGDENKVSSTNTHDAVAENDDPAVVEDLADTLRDQIAFLKSLLELLQALGGDPAQAFAENEVVFAQLTQVKVTTLSASLQVRSSVFGQQPGTNLSLLDAMHAVQKTLTEMQSMVSLAGDMQGVNKFSTLLGQDSALSVSDFRKMLQSLAETMRDFSQSFAGGSKRETATVAGMNDLAEQVRDVLGKSKELLAKIMAHAADNMQMADKSSALADVASAAQSTSGKHTVVNHFNDALSSPVGAQMAVSSTENSASNVVAAAFVSSASTVGADTSTDAGAGQNGGQSMSQATSTLRESGGAQSSSSASSTAFSKLLERNEKPVIEQVSVRIRTAIADGSSKIDIKLDPESLGKVEIKINVGADGKTGVTVTADNRSTLDMLQRDARGLEQALSDAGLKTDAGSLSFNLRGGEHEQKQGMFAAQTYQKVMPEEEELEPVMITSETYAVEVADGLDIRI